MSAIPARPARRQRRVISMVTTFEKIAVAPLGPGMEATHLIRDGDKKYAQQFNEFLKAGGTEIVRIPPAAPNMNPFAERWCQSLQTECLDHFIILGESHLRYLVHEYLAYYHNCRPHQSMGNEPLIKAGNDLPPSTGRIVCQERLGGLLKHYYRKAA